MLTPSLLLVVECQTWWHWLDVVTGTPASCVCVISPNFLQPSSSERRQSRPDSCQPGMLLSPLSWSRVSHSHPRHGSRVSVVMSLTRALGAHRARSTRHHALSVSVASQSGTVNENPFLAPVNLMLVSCVMWQLVWGSSETLSGQHHQWPPPQPIIRPGPDPDYCEICPSNWITWCNVETRLWFWSSDLILNGHLNDFL